VYTVGSLFKVLVIMMAHEIVDRAFGSRGNNILQNVQLGGSDNVPTSTESARFLLHAVMMDVS
jgi:hypothetical protein